ncbi:hypothetical protein DsansV1_C44g0240421 [Dioscorea sansibarensis]
MHRTNFAPFNTCFHLHLFIYSTALPNSNLNFSSFFVFSFAAQISNVRSLGCPKKHGTSSLIRLYAYLHHFRRGWMPLKASYFMDLKSSADIENAPSIRRVRHDFWPLDGVDPKKARFPCCVVWTPLPVVSWLAPYIGHLGICREDGAVVDFAGSNIVSIDNFAYGKVARYLQLDREQCCFPLNIAKHTCEQAYQHAERGTATSWDNALQANMQQFQHKCYNLFTCNCHSFVANCMNRLCYNRSLGWNMINLAALVLWRGKWVDGMSVFRSFFPFTIVLCVGLLTAGWPFLIGLASFSFLLIGWYLFGTYCVKNLIQC